MIEHRRVPPPRGLAKPALWWREIGFPIPSDVPDDAVGVVKPDGFIEFTWTQA